MERGRYPSGPETAKGAAGRPAADPEASLWENFVKAKTAEAFVRSWLALQCRMVGGVRAGVVLLGTPDRGPFTPAAVWPHPTRSVKYLIPTAERALKERRGLLLKGEVNGDQSGAAAERFEVAYPIQVEGKLYGVVVLDVPPRSEAQLQAVLRQLHWGAGWLEVLFRREDAAREVAATEKLKTVLDLAATILEQERFYGAVTAFVTALATRVDCDRVSLGLVRGGRVHTRAVSHSAQFRKETNLIRAIEAAMEESLDQGAVIVYPESRERDIQVSRAHADLARQHGSGAICSVPLYDSGKVVGVLTLERPEGRPFEAETEELCVGIGAVAGPILEVKRREDRWLITKAAGAFRTELLHLLGPRHVALKLGVGIVAALIAFFIFAKGDYRVTAKTVLEAQVQRAVVAPFSGYITEARVRAGDLVRAGQMLAALDERDLRLERQKWMSQHDQLLKQYHQALGTSNAAQARIVTAQLDQARAQIALLDDQLSRTRLLSPFEGVVVSGDLSQSLGAPVERGQVLFEVAPLDVYRVILEVDEYDIDGVRDGQQGTLVLAATPGRPVAFTVEKITPVSTAREGRNFFRVEARLQAPPGRLRPGMEGVGKIEVDRRLLLWIWTDDLVDWLRLTVWSLLP